VYPVCAPHVALTRKLPRNGTRPLGVAAGRVAADELGTLRTSGRIVNAMIARRRTGTTGSFGREMLLLLGLSTGTRPAFTIAARRT
jgi:hypothetical protein